MRWSRNADGALEFRDNENKLRGGSWVEGNRHVAVAYEPFGESGFGSPKSFHNTKKEAMSWVEKLIKTGVIP